VAELVARPAWEGVELPFACGGVTLAAGPEAAALSLSPFRGRAEAMAAALGAQLPAPGGSVVLGPDARLVWAGLDQWLLRGAAAADLAARMAGLAAVVDQSDGWAALTLTGPDAAEALARLAPVDLSSAAFPEGRAARTELRHVACLILAAPDGYEIHAPRSFAATVAQEIAGAMRMLAARAALA
jgi:sarcosine oxidase subunit gamma